VVQKNLKIFVIEAEKKEDDIKKNKFLINQLSKTITDNSKTLAEFGMAPPIIFKIKSMIPLDISSISNNDKKLDFKEKNSICENNDDEIKDDSRYAKNAIFPPIDNMDNPVYDNQNNELLIDTDDTNRVF
jgi:hypothetical protein